MIRPHRHPASPRARKAAARLGIALETLTGSGPGGRIVEADVLNAPPALQQGNRRSSSPRARKTAAKLGIALDRIHGSGPNGRIIEADVIKAAASPVAKGTRRPFTGMRRTIATRLTESKQTIPHFYMKKTVRMRALLAFLAERKNLHPCTLNDLFLKATAIAIRELPAFRTRIEGDEIVELEDVNLGIAVGIEGGVVVPVLLNADVLPLADLATETKRLVGLARERRIENSGRGVFTLSNLGMFGVEEFSAIINPPESGILAIGAARDDAASGEKLLTLNLSCDHRVVDGMAAALFLNRLTEIIEAPSAQLGETSASPAISVTREQGEYDVIVVGSGPGGYVAALQAAELGAKVAVIEKSAHLGGTCLNHGCIPSKALLASAETLHRIHAAGEFGIRVPDGTTADWTAIQQRKDQILKNLRSGIGSLFKGRGITLLQGHGRLEGPGKLSYEFEGRLQPVTATSIILAPGSTPAMLPGFPQNDARVATTDAALHWNSLPKSLLIIGGGVIGIEFACMMQALGTAVAIIEKAPRILPEMDETLAGGMADILRKRGVKIHAGCEILDFQLTETGCRAILPGGVELSGERTLMAVGRRPATGDIGLTNLNLNTDRGFLKTGDDLSVAPGIFCVGDANGICMLAHAASAQGRVAAHLALGHAMALPKVIPSAVYTFPEIASVGISEEQAAKQGIATATGMFPLRNLGKAMASGETAGFVKVVREKDSGVLLGVHALGHSAIEFSTAALTLVGSRASARELANLVFPHPSMSEAMAEAAEDSYSAALHLPPRRQC